MAENSTDFIPCMLIPLQQHYLLLPNSTIAEVIPMPSITAVSDKPDFWVGECHWHSRELPVINLEALIGNDVTDVSDANKLCVLHGINEDSNIPVYSMPCYGVPQLIYLNESALLQATDSQDSEFLLYELQVGKKVAYIPNLDTIETSINP